MDANIGVVLKNLQNLSAANEEEEILLQKQREKNKTQKKLMNFAHSMAILGLWFRKNKVENVTFRFEKRANKQKETFLHLSGIDATQIRRTSEIYSFSDLEGFKTGYKISQDVDSCEALLQRLIHPSNYRVINSLKAAFFDDTEEEGLLEFSKNEVEEFLAKVQESGESFLNEVELYILRRLTR